MPIAARVRGELWGLRSGNHRLFYFAFIDNQFVILHAYRKKSQKAPEREKKTTLQEWKKEKLKDPEFAQAYEETNPGYQVARLRIRKGLTQTELAKLAGTHQPAIARLEDGEDLPSLSFLRRVVEAMEGRLEVIISE